MKRILLFLSLICLVSISCNPNRIYSKQVEIPQMTWDMNEPASFEVNIDDENVNYDITIDLRAVDFYQFSNLWLYIVTEAPNNAVKADTMECILYDEKGFSESTNKLRFGELEDYEFKFKENIKFATKGVYKFTIQHGMRIEKLPYINEIGLTIEKNTN
ncbi:MAG: gliding motility lipoprotein GldH [Bacteroidales bacterium]|nr:gliding motility lipoprotein GldH [Bacteroidales bacterium]